LKADATREFAGRRRKLPLFQRTEKAFADD
jgi:hypothetical protein